MTRSEKAQFISELTEALKESNAVVVCDYKGMTCQELESVRKIAAQNSVHIKVVKNTLAMIALKEAGIEGLELTGTNALVWGEDQISTCKTADKAATEFKDKFVIKAGALEGKATDLSTIMAMAKLPSREELLGMLLNVWQAPIRNFTVGLDNLRKKLEEESK
ncbi:MAG: 50S ribosomal protein L10 [Epsilonproteobacteria bacterium]|jgi:large subunit ribosomal protein L10|nr:50S ribosomal protein L10 [Campylobacterota bacterium]